MSGKIPRPIGSIAFVATLLVSGVGIGVPANTARAADCLAAPNSPAPQGEPLVLPPGLDKSAQVLVLPCARPAGATSGCAGYIRSGASRTIAFDAGAVWAACDSNSQRSSVNKPRRQRSVLAASQNACRQAKACIRDQHDDRQTYPAKRAGGKYRAVNSRSTHSARKQAVAD